MCCSVFAARRAVEKLAGVAAGALSAQRAALRYVPPTFGGMLCCVVIPRSTLCVRCLRQFLSLCRADVCVCVCVCVRERKRALAIVVVLVCVCVCKCVSVALSPLFRALLAFAPSLESAWLAARVTHKSPLTLATLSPWPLRRQWATSTRR